jgi:hypothetical protein
MRGNELKIRWKIRGDNRTLVQMEEEKPWDGGEKWNEEYEKELTGE